MTGPKAVERSIHFNVTKLVKLGTNASRRRRIAVLAVSSPTDQADADSEFFLHRYF